jgi:hypothetical protein
MLHSLALCDGAPSRNHALNVYAGSGCFLGIYWGQRLVWWFSALARCWYFRTAARQLWPVATLAKAKPSLTRLTEYVAAR